MCDVMGKSAIEKMTSSLPAINVLFNCAGFVHAGTALDATHDQWDVAFDLNVHSQFWTVQAALPHMLASKKGSITLMASVVSIKGLPNRFVYGMSKAAVISLIKSVAAEFVMQGICCNAIFPRTVDTPSLADRIHVFEDLVQARQNFIGRHPTGRLAEAHEIASIVVFLARNESAFVTGQAYGIDGGMTI